MNRDHTHTHTHTHTKFSLAYNYTTPVKLTARSDLSYLHVDVVNKDGHLLASGWSIYAANALVHIALNGPLKIRQAETTQIN